MATALRMPQLGITMTEGKVVRWLKRDGDPVRRGEPVLEIETDKLNAEVEANADGVLRRRVADEGATVKVVGLLGVIAAPDESDAAVEAVVAEARQRATAPAAAPAARSSAPAAPAARPRAAAEGARVPVSPIARRLAQELGVDLSTVTGSGPGGRIVEGDVRAAAAGQGDAETQRRRDAERGAVPASLRPAVPASVGLPDLPRRQTVPLTGMRRLIGERLSYSAQTAAQLTVITEADAGALVERRVHLAAAAAGGRVPTYTDLLVYLVARVLREHPLLNASLAGDEIVCWDVVNVGVAAALERGLIVPVVREADRKSLVQLAAETADLVERARANRLTVDELRGGTFTITNLGMYEMDAFTPIINPPECAILGVGRIVDRPVARDGQVVIRPMLTLSLSFDHRIVDGAPAAVFLRDVKRAIEAAALGEGS